uniref:Chromosome 15 open reading frame 40 n=1 Tax=Aotus nancymaae TaxID=37293 RepID=A0A2K5DCB9_AOTNA
MLRLYRVLRQVGAEPSTWGSARLPLAAEMPKKAGATTKGKSQSKEPERPLPPLGPVAVDPKGCVTIAIHAKPGSKQNAVTDLTAEAVNVAIAAPPSDGEANAELCRYLSKVLELRKSDVVLDKTGSCYIAKAGPELLASSDLFTLASQSAGITGVSHDTQPALLLISL